ncbi:exodeoxyribonuclease V subunit gamma [Gordonia sp. NPDC003950]
MLTLHRAERTDVLADALGQVLTTPLADPMRTEVVAVPARGVERWLSQRLATRLGVSGADGAGRSTADGIAANIDFSSPAALTDVVIEQVTTSAAKSAATDLWQPGSLVWPVLDVLDDLITDPDLRVLARHVGLGPDARADDPRVGRRYATARHIADLFERYARHRPAMLTGWASGDDTDGSGQRLPDDMTWQPRFWREVRSRIGAAHPVEALDAVCERLAADATTTDLPERLSVFGPTRVTESFRRVAASLAAHRDVHLFIPHPGPALWAAIASQPAPTDRRRASWTPPALRNPLLSGLSRDVQELQLRIMDDLDADIHHAPAEPTASPTSVLAAVQEGIRDDTDPRDRPGILTPDSSVEVHACHGPERQVEALRDRLLHLFDADASLQPRDVIIMCPDVETFAPLIRGVFGQPGLDHPASALRVRLADRGLRHVNPILDVVARVVELAAGRVSAGDVADLLALEPVSQRFEMTDDDLEWVREWLSRTGIRWGIDNTQRARFGLAGLAQGTFDVGLDRIALGVVAGAGEGLWLGTALPMEGLESTQIDLVGRLAEFVDRLGDLLARMAESAPAATWAAALLDIVATLTATVPGDEWQTAAATRALTESLGDGADPESDTSSRVLRLSDVRDLVATMIAGRPTRANFRTGELTVCTLVPMRTVPHRVVVLLGIDTDAFPRALRIDGDDVLGRVPMLGERQPRDEDRQLFLDAVNAAHEHLLVFYTGADPVRGTRVPPAVVVSELTEVVAALTGTEPDAVICRHPLHGFDARNFTPGAFEGVEGPFGYDTALLAGARAVGGDHHAPARVADITMPADSESVSADIELGSLTAFFGNPIEGFIRQRLGARLPDDDAEDSDRLDVAVAGLDEWAIGDRLLRQTLAGVDLRTAQMAEMRRGSLPPIEFGRRELIRISRQVGNVHRVAAGLRTGSGGSRDVVLDLPDGGRLHGSVPDVYGETIIEATYSKIRAKQRLAAWVRLLATAEAQQQSAPSGERIHTAVVIGRADRRSSHVTAVSLRVPDDPTAVLADLIAIYRLGLCVPLPVPLDPGLAYAEKCVRGSSAEIARRAAAAKFDYRFGAQADPYIRFAYGDDVTTAVGFDALTEVPIPDDPRWSAIGLVPGEPMFGALATRIWEPLLAHEVIR